jgi:hypothetical protein
VQKVTLVRSYHRLIAMAVRGSGMLQTDRTKGTSFVDNTRRSEAHTSNSPAVSVNPLKNDLNFISHSVPHSKHTPS